ncbi:MAG: hypothetical protein IH840_10420 [Candidatus Heimdallarchaeota archaeon]|nr:hypothetical protein [Candidatus Heimdallarchaeota archaeon]
MKVNRSKEISEPPTDRQQKYRPIDLSSPICDNPDHVSRHYPAGKILCEWQDRHSHQDGSSQIAPDRYVTPCGNARTAPARLSLRDQTTVVYPSGTQWSTYLLVGDLGPSDGTILPCHRATDAIQKRRVLTNCGIWLVPLTYRADR